MHCFIIRRRRVQALLETLFILRVQDCTYVGQWLDPWQDNFKIFTIYMYKWHFGKPNMEIWKTHPSINSQICKLYIQISNIHMCVVPGPTSQDAVFIRRVYRVYSMLICNFLKKGVIAEWYSALTSVMRGVGLNPTEV